MKDQFFYWVLIGTYQVREYVMVYFSAFFFLAWSFDDRRVCVWGLRNILTEHSSVYYDNGYKKEFIYISDYKSRFTY